MNRSTFITLVACVVFILPSCAGNKPMSGAPDRSSLALEPIKLRDSMGIPMAIGGTGPDGNLHYLSHPGTGKVIRTKNGIVIKTIGIEGPQFMGYVGYPIKAITTQGAKLEFSTKLDIWQYFGGGQPLTVHTYIWPERANASDSIVSDLEARFTSATAGNAINIEVLSDISVDRNDAFKLLITIKDKGRKPLGWQGYVVLPKDSGRDVMGYLAGP